MNTKPAIWFSRHNPTKAQIESARALGYEITCIEEGKKLGAMDLRENQDVVAVASVLLGLVGANDAVAIFGVPSAPILAQFQRTASDAVYRGEWLDGGQSLNEESREFEQLLLEDIPFFAAWNVQRSEEGGKPTFEHKEWVMAGRISQNSLRWIK